MKITDETAGKYAFISKSGEVLKSWNKKPSEEQAHGVLVRAKTHG